MIKYGEKLILLERNMLQYDVGGKKTLLWESPTNPTHLLLSVNRFVLGLRGHVLEPCIFQLVVQGLVVRQLQVPHVAFMVLEPRWSMD